MKKFLFTSLLMFLLNFSLSGQFDPDDRCPVLAEGSVRGTLRSGTIGTMSLLQVGGTYKPASNSQTQNEYFKVLIVFAQFSDENIQSTVWPLNQRPVYANNLVDQTRSSSYRAGTLSDYWKVMSHGNFDFIGDVYPSLVILPSEASYVAANKKIDDINKDVLSAIDANVDFANYDNWKLEGGQFVFQEHNADGYVDMILICYREQYDREDDFAFATLGHSSWTVVKDGKNINCPGFYVTALSSGLTILNSRDTDEYTLKQTMIHEFGHFLFGGGHTSTSGIMSGAGNVSRTLALSGWESERLGYVAYTVANQDGFTFPMGDYINNGNVLKIPIPISNPSSSTFFVVENHQRLSMYDQIIRGGSLGGGWNFSTTLGKGIYIQYITNGNSYPCTNVWRTADGSWNWVLNGTISMPAGWPPVMPLTKRDAINRNTGKSDRHPQNVYWNDGSGYAWWGKWHDQDQSTGQYSLTRDIMGDEYDAFNLGFNEIFTPWSNPSTYSGGTTNISVQLYSQNGNQITVKVFTTYNSSLALPPSKPQNLQIGPNPGNNFLKITWDANLESDLSLYEVWRKIDNYNYSVIGTTNNLYYVDPDWEWTSSTAYKLYYKIRAKDINNNYSIYSDAVSSWAWPTKQNADEDEDITTNSESVSEYSLSNYPNPFNPTTRIVYKLKEKGFVSLKVYDILGKEVAELVNEVKAEGIYVTEFKASDLPSGIYIYSLRVNDFVSNQKMILLK